MTATVAELLLLLLFLVPNCEVSIAAQSGDNMQRRPVTDSGSIQPGRPSLCSLRFRALRRPSGPLPRTLPPHLLSLWSLLPVPLPDEGSRLLSCFRPTPFHSRCLTLALASLSPRCPLRCHRSFHLAPLCLPSPLPLVYPTPSRATGTFLSPRGTFPAPIATPFLQTAEPGQKQREGAGQAGGSCSSPGEESTQAPHIFHFLAPFSLI